LAHPMTFEQMAELAHRGLVRRGLPARSMPAKPRKLSEP
jgi:hypothetical protein